MSTSPHFDDIVVGGGSSGAVLAARLSEERSRRVLLLEAGPDFAHPEDLPAPLLNAHEPVLGGYNWLFNAHVRGGNPHALHELVGAARVLATSPRDAWSAAKAVVHAAQPLSTTLHTFPYVPGKVMGGSSAINGAVALRPAPGDFDTWADLGCEGWGWHEVLPFFRKLECDRDFAGPSHGTLGPLPIARPSLGQLSPTQAAFRTTCLAHGFEAVDDLNTNAQAGVGLLPSNANGRTRISTALAYLLPARANGNLQVQGQSQVKRILFEGKRAVGVEVDRAAGIQAYFAKRVIVCAGAINTPALLLRSGVGDADQCQRLGLRPVAHLPGVGKNLADHPALMFWMRPRDASDAGAARRFPQHQVMARAPSRIGGNPDLNLFFLGGFDTAHIPMLAGVLKSPTAHAMSVVLAKPLSRGQVYLTNADPATPPVVELNLCAAPADMECLMAGARLAWKLTHHDAMRGLADSIFMWNDTIIGNDALLRTAILRFVSGTWHATGTARMGRDDDALAVVDSRFKVHQLNQLYVVDASVMPSIPSTPTNLTCIMLAERAAAWLSGASRDA